MVPAPPPELLLRADEEFARRELVRVGGLPVAVQCGPSERGVLFRVREGQIDPQRLDQRRRLRGFPRRIVRARVGVHVNGPAVAKRAPARDGEQRRATRRTVHPRVRELRAAANRLQSRVVVFFRGAASAAAAQKNILGDVRRGFARVADVGE